MSKNLNVKIFQNGDPIPQATSAQEWQIAGENQKPAWCYYEFNPSNEEKYGILYNWYAVVDLRGLAPTGYHIPSKIEWEELNKFLGGDSNVAKTIKSSSGWNTYKTGGSITCPNCKDWTTEYRKKVPCHSCKDSRKVMTPEVTNSGNGTNTSGFNGLPGGIINKYGSSSKIGSEGFWWSSISGMAGTNYAFYANLGNESNYLHIFGNGYFSEGHMSNGMSVRCIKDNTTLIDQIEKNLNDLIEQNRFIEAYQLIETEGKLKRIDTKNLNIFLKNWNENFSTHINQLIDKHDFKNAIDLINFYDKKKHLYLNVESERKLIIIWMDKINSIEQNDKITAVTSQPLKEFEHLFIGSWIFESKTFYRDYAATGEILEEVWTINSDRTYTYEGRMRYSNQKNYHTVYNEKGVFTIEQGSSGEYFFNAYITEEDGKQTWRVEKVKFDQLNTKGAIRTISFKDVKNPITLKGKKL
jgi:hypothetical protein